jgi:carbamate kinase
MSKLVVVAVGGNALLVRNEAMSADEEFGHAMTIARAVVHLIKSGYKVVLTHGNGPQVGAALLRSELSAGSLYRLPLDCCVASTQGEIGYVLQYAMWQMMQKEKVHVPVVSLVTQVLVARNDPAFAHPSKPIGPFYTKEVAERYHLDYGWTMVQEGERGYRRVVPSPEPLAIVEIDAIRACVGHGLAVITAGGGGIPVFNDHDITKGVEAVVDKDLTSALLADELAADVFAIVTGEEHVYVNFGTPAQHPLSQLSVEECKQYLAQGQFPEGSMGPKIRAVLKYLQAGGREAIITDINHLHEAIDGSAGTHITMWPEMVDWP